MPMRRSNLHKYPQVRMQFPRVALHKLWIVGPPSGHGSDEQIFGIEAQFLCPLPYFAMCPGAFLVGEVARLERQDALRFQDAPELVEGTSVCVAQLFERLKLRKGGIQGCGVEYPRETLLSGRFVP